MSAVRLRISFTLLLLVFAALSWSKTALYAAAPISWGSGVQGGFLTCLCADHSNHFWVGTEGQGVWRYDFLAAEGKRWWHFTKRSGLGDDSPTAMVCDKHGRMWVGTVSHGVSVYTGSEWRTYNAPDGPLGCHVFALAAAPGAGDVWAATECGLSRFSLETQTWSHYTRRDGLPPGGAMALTFAKDGTLFVGTQCDGLAIGSGSDDYKTWRLVPGPAKMPVTPSGSGLPSGMINCLLAAEDGAIYVGTTCGLARSRDIGKSWVYTRGADWLDKVKGLWHGPKPRETGPFPASLKEDYVTCLAEDAAGRLVIGHRRQGVELWDTKSQTPFAPLSSGTPTEHATCLLAWWDGTYLTGWYGAGLAQVVPPDPAPFPPSPLDFSDWGGVARLPKAAAVPTLTQLNALAAEVTAIPPNPKEMEPFVTELPDDWRTAGDWLGRYGRYWACLCATFHPIPEDYLWGAGWEPVNYSLTVGPSHESGDSLRYWLEWRYTNNPRVLELPPTYLHSRVLRGYTDWNTGRRETEVDDHGETYPKAMEGPNIYATLTVPEGLYTLALYEFNKDGHDGENDCRDYRISVRTHTGMTLEDVDEFGSQPELAQGRVKDFCGGVWKRFLVRGPMTLTVEANRNNSFNTILSCVMLDLLDEDPAPYFQTVEQWSVREAGRDKQRALWTAKPTSFVPAATEAEAADLLFERLNEKRLTNSTWWATEGRRYYPALQRWYLSVLPKVTGEARKRQFIRLATCAYENGQYPLWEEWQKAAGLTTARQIELSLRWDGLIDSCSGLGGEIVTTHLAAKFGRKVSKSP